MSYSTPPHQQPGPRVLLIGIGGPTCSGKTTLTKHLLSLLSASSPSSSSSPTSFIIHQDDFAPPESSLVWNDEVGSADWDDPATSVHWPRLRSTLAFVKAHGELPTDHASHDEANPLPERPLAKDIADKYRRAFRDALDQRQSADGQRRRPTHVVFLDGFLLYYDQQVRSMIDVPIFLRIGRGLLEERRARRGGYVTADGEKWEDPPLYFSHILWPSHLKAHSHLFEDGDVEAGQVLPLSRVSTSDVDITLVGKGKEGEGERGGKNAALRVIEVQHSPGRGDPRGIDEIVQEGCEIVLHALKGWEGG